MRRDPFHRFTGRSSGGGIPGRVHAGMWTPPSDNTPPPRVTNWPPHVRVSFPTDWTQREHFHDWYYTTNFNASLGPTGDVQACLWCHRTRPRKIYTTAYVGKPILELET